MRISLCKRKDWNVLVTTYQLATGDRIDKRFLKDQLFNVSPCPSEILYADIPRFVSTMRDISLKIVRPIVTTHS